MDLDVGKWLRKNAPGMKTIVVMNKAESLDDYDGSLAAAVGESYTLGFGDPIALSAETGMGMAELHETLRPLLEEYVLQNVNGKKLMPQREFWCLVIIHLYLNLLVLFKVLFQRRSFFLINVLIIYLFISLCLPVSVHSVVTWNRIFIWLLQMLPLSVLRLVYFCMVKLNINLSILAKGISINNMSAGSGCCYDLCGLLKTAQYG